MLRLLLTAMLVLALDMPGARAESDIGVVLMHGKQGGPNLPALSSLAGTLETKGIKVLRPRMPWAAGEWENIAVPAETVFAQIDGFAAELRAKGARRIAVGGHSLGANMALSYAVERGGVAGVVMLAPGHSPGVLYQRVPEFRAAVDKAQQLVASGQGAQHLSAPDNNQGRTFSVSTTAKVYLSWMSPRGLASMPAQAPRLSPNIPLLLVIGNKDPSFAIAETTIYRPAAKHPYSKYEPVQADHVGAVSSSIGAVTNWLQGLPAN
jgi:pimeloyl-ACP methyl ester carboxylesterase